MELPMKFFKKARKFNDNEDGAVTVDWVVLTAAVVGLGVAALAAIKGGTGSLTTKINQRLSSQSISTTF
jgi:Flp pilus assembly pilin Flp